MQALVDYNKSSDWQLKAASSTIEDLISVFRHAATLTNSTIVACDYGSSEGLNSAKIFSSAIQTIRATIQTPIHIIHNDLPSNNWNKLASVLYSNDGYLKYPDTYSSSVAKSFFERVVPNETLHIAFSTSSFQYLSKQVVSPDSIEACLSEIPEIRAQASEQGEADMLEILRLRYEELVPGGRCVFLIHCMPDEGKMMHAELLSKAHNSLFAKRVITEEEYKSFKRPNHYRTKTEWDRIFSKVSSQYKLVSYETKSFISPFYEKFLADGDQEGYANSIKNFFRPLTQAAFLKSIARSPEEKTEIFEEFLNEIGNQLLEGDPDVRIWYSSIILEKIS
ncbi:unnamed protein product [Blepharisma stoltei]|uniref:SAM dependent carboxyl methyltransferase n=1 Tax=Blepharisma stoltei TaxID=1481888 RepID=A0AAU9K777_9CILI|nr:unnamed protein product [Blepharisma stoltei]